MFYNGKSVKEDRILKLSESFPVNVDPDRSDVQVQVHMYNVRPQYGSNLLTECKALSEYSWFVEEVRRNCETMEVDPSVDKAIKDMPEDFEIRKFLIEHQSEVRNMCLTEYNEAETMEMFKQEAREEGRKEGRNKDIADMLRRGKTVEAIVEFCNYPYDQVKEVADSLAKCMF